MEKKSHVDFLQSSWFLKFKKNCSIHSIIQSKVDYSITIVTFSGLVLLDPIINSLFHIICQ